MGTNLILALIVVVVGSVGYAMANTEPVAVDLPEGYLDGKPDGWTDQHEKAEERLEYLAEQTQEERQRILEEYHEFKNSQSDGSDAIEAEETETETIEEDPAEPDAGKNIEMLVECEDKTWISVEDHAVTVECVTVDYRDMID